MTRPYIMVAPSGARKTKSDHPEIPISIPDTVETAKSCHEAGADAIHLHVRNADGSHSIDAGQYREAIGELKRVVPNMDVQVSTEYAGIYAVTDQLQTLADLAPDWASISVREIARDMSLADRVYGTCADNGTVVQHILFDAADAEQLRHWQEKGLVRADQNSAILVLGRYTKDMNSDPEALAPFVESLPPLRRWMLCAFGPQEHACLLQAAELGGDIRVGFENSTVDAYGAPHMNNADSVRKLVAALAERGL